MTDETDGTHRADAGDGGARGHGEDDLVFRGPGEALRPDGLPWADSELPGGVGHTTAAAGVGGAGLALLGLAGIVSRRRERQRFAALDEDDR